MDTYSLYHRQACDGGQSPRKGGLGVRLQRKHGDTRCRRLPREEWIAFIPDAHPGYISWEEYEANVARLRENSAARGKERRKSPPREGPVRGSR